MNVGQLFVSFFQTWLDITEVVNSVEISVTWGGTSSHGIAHSLMEEIITPRQSA
jgi:hypothetical protein